MSEPWNVDWSATLTAVASAVIISVGAGMLAWLKQSYSRFKSMDNSLIESNRRMEKIDENITLMQRRWRRSIKKQVKSDERIEKIEITQCKHTKSLDDHSKQLTELVRRTQFDQGSSHGHGHQERHEHHGPHQH